MSFWVYILTNRHNTTLYIGVTNDPYQRLQQHRSGEGSRFTSKYRLTKCIYLEESPTAVEAIAREKQLKGWTRRRKEALINAVNPQWAELLMDPE